MDHCFKFLTFEIFLSSLSLILFSSLLNPEYLNIEQNPIHNSRYKYIFGFFFTLLFNVYAVRDLFVLSGNQLFKWKILQSGASNIQEKVMPVKLC